MCERVGPTEYSGIRLVCDLGCTGGAYARKIQVVNIPIDIDCENLNRYCIVNISIDIALRYCTNTMDVKHLIVFTPFGVLTFQGPIKSTCTIYHGVASATFTGNLPYCFPVFY
jgi:hypothetical protein